MLVSFTFLLHLSSKAKYKKKNNRKMKQALKLYWKFGNCLYRFTIKEKENYG